MMHSSLCPLAIVAVCASSSWSAAQCANTWQRTGSVPGIDGTVSAATAWDPDGPGPATPRVAFAGSFSMAGGVVASKVAAWDPATGTWSAIGSGIDSAQTVVLALLALPNGDLIAGGSCHDSGSTAHALMRWDGTSWTPFGGITPVHLAVQALALLPNGDIAVGGYLSAAGTISLNGIGVWNGTAWSQLGSGTNGSVFALEVLPNGDLVAGGSFTAAGGVAAHGVARWNGTSWSALGSVPDVRDLAVAANGDLVAAGGFTQAGGVPANRVARWNGATWSALGSGLSGTGTAYVGASSIVVLANGDIVVGGSFDVAGGAPAGSIARWDGSAWSALGAGIGAATSTFGVAAALVPLANGDLVVGGRFAVAGGVPTSAVARWDGAAWSALAGGSAPSSGVWALENMPDGSLVAGGFFLTVGGIEAEHVARWDGVAWSPLGSGLPSHVHSFAVTPNGDLYAGSRDTVSRWDGAAWSMVGNAAFHEVLALTALPNGDVVAAFAYGSAGTTFLMGGIARWDGASWSQLGEPIFGTVWDLEVLPDGDLLAAGSFVTNSMGAGHRIARWDGATWSDIGGFGTGAVHAIDVLPDGRLLAAGAFQSLGGVPAANVAIWNGSTWSPLGSGVQPVAYDVLALPNGDVLVSGWLAQAGGTPVSHVARWNGTTWSAVGVGIGPTGDGVRALAIRPNGDVVVGGFFHSAGGLPSQNLTVLTTTCPAAVQSTGAGCAGDTLTATLPWTGSTWRADGSGLPSSAIVAAVSGFATAALPLVAVFATALPGCTLHVQPDHVDLVLATNGAAATQFSFPNTPVLAGIVFHHQMVPLALDATLAVTATNALQLTVGSF